MQVGRENRDIACHCCTARVHVAWPGHVDAGVPWERKRERKRRGSPSLLSPYPGDVAIFTLRSGRVRCRAKKYVCMYIHTYVLFSPFSLPASLPPPSAPDFSPYAGENERLRYVIRTHAYRLCPPSPPPRFSLSPAIAARQGVESAGRARAPLQDEWT